MTDDPLLDMVLWLLIAFSIFYVGGLLGVRLLFGVELVKLPHGSGLRVSIGWTRGKHAQSS